MKDYVELEIKIKYFDLEDCIRTSTGASYFSSGGLAEDDVVDWFSKGGFAQ